MSAIADMVAPVVLITLATIFANGLNTLSIALTDRAQDAQALALVLAGLAGVFAGIATVIVSAAKPADSPVEAIRRTGVVG